MAIFTEWVSLLLISNFGCLYGIRIHVQMLSLTSIEASCQGSMMSAIFYRKTATGKTFENIVKVVNDNNECKTKTVLSKTTVECFCKDRTQVRCVISEMKFHYSDEWYCATFTNGSIVNSDTVSMSKQDIMRQVEEVGRTTDSTQTDEVSVTITDEMAKFNSFAVQTAGAVENVTETPNFYNNANVLVASAVSVGFVVIAAVISISVFVYQKYSVQSGDVVDERRTQIPIDITLITDCTPEMHTNARQGIHSYVEIIPSTPPPRHTDIEMPNDAQSLDENSEPSSTELTTSTNHYESIPTSIQSAKSGSDDVSHIDVRSLSLTDNTVSMEYSCADIHHGNIFQSVHMDTLADIAVITDIAKGTVALRNRGSDDYRYESLIGTRFDKSQYNSFDCQQGGN